MANHGNSYLIIGAGIQADAIAQHLLIDEHTWKVTFFERDRKALGAARERFAGFGGRALFVRGDALSRECEELMGDHDVAIGAAHYTLNVGLTKTAIRTRTHFCDLGGNNDVVREQFALSDAARAAGVKIAPDCGIAPGAASVLVAYLYDLLGGDVDQINMYCGGLMQHPAGPLRYGKLFGIGGLINEYREPVLALIDGEARTIEPLRYRHNIDFPVIGKLEAATTSGGCSTLVDTYKGRIRNLGYWTLRYPAAEGHASHWDQMQILRDLGMFDGEAREFLEEHLDRTLPPGVPDLLALRIAAWTHGGEKVTLDLLDRYDPETGHSAMQRTTGYSAAIVANMLANSGIMGYGTLRHEEAIPATRFVQELAGRGIGVSVTRNAK